MTRIQDLPDERKDADDESDIEDISLEDRKKDWSGYAKIKEQIGKIYKIVDQAYDDKYEFVETVNECWDIYNCTLSEKQQYNGKSQIYLPIVRDAMNARVTRFINMLFPRAGRYADVVTSDGSTPYDQIALLDYYVRQAKLRNMIIPGMIRGGDVSGNYALYVEWGIKSRFVVSKIKVPENVTELGTAVDGTEEYDDVEYLETKDEHPVFSILDARNLVILPATATVEDAETVCVLLRYTESKIREMVREKVFEEAAAERLIESMGEVKSGNRVNTGKKALGAAGIQTDAKGNKTALIYQIWTKLKIKGKYRLMVAHMAGEDICLGCKRNPFWNDRIPVIWQPAEKEGDSGYGKSQVDPVKHLQYAANDAVNMGMDSAQYALLPLVMTDPEKNPQLGSMILSMAAVWPVDPNSTKFVEFPPLWRDAFSIVGAAKEQIFQSLGVNPAMIPQGHGSKKPSQAEVAQEQVVMLETTNDEVSILEEMLGQVLEWMYDLDYQYRTKDITIKKFGEMGIQAMMMQVKPFQTRERLWFRWFGLESFKATQQVQQMISWGATLMKMPPQALNGRRVDLGPMLEYITEVTCGPRIAPKVLIDQRHMLSLSPMQEDELMRSGFPVQTHPMDNDPEHLQQHMQDYQIAPSEYLKGHILEHIKQMKEKAAMQQQAAIGAPAGVGNPDRAGAQKQMPTGAQQPAGAVRPDAMAMGMPRKSIQ